MHSNSSQKSLASPTKVVERMRQSPVGRLVANRSVAFFVMALAWVLLALFAIWAVFKTRLGDIRIPGFAEPLRYHLAKLLSVLKVPELLAKLGKYGRWITALLCPGKDVESGSKQKEKTSQQSPEQTQEQSERQHSQQQ